MKVKKTYITEDGKTFDSEVEARHHEEEVRCAKELAKKNVINGLTKQDIINFFLSQGCPVCPFQEECEHMYNHIRRSTTDTFNLCSVIKNKM